MVISVSRDKSRVDKSGGFDLSAADLIWAAADSQFLISDQKRFNKLILLPPKLHVEDEQGPPECWAVVVAALEWWQLWWPWQTS
uniref:Uncharacterized protein n=1 Tax=Fagus sylvatica TaxID=28930 RepID=A0A2N9I7K7_FAGSY